MRAASLLIAALLLSGCASSTTTATNVQLVRSLYEAFGRGDVPVVLAGLDSTVVWNEAEGHAYSDRNPYRGPQGVAEGVFQRIGTEWSSFSVAPTEFIESGNTVVVLGRYAGNFKATGRPLDAQFAHVWTLRDGKVVGFQQYTDTAQYARVMTP